MIVSEDDLANLTYEQIEETLIQIKKIEERLEEKKKELEVIPLVYDIGKCYIVNGYSASASAEAEATYCPKKAMNGVYRKSSINALNSAKRRINANIIEAYAERIDPLFAPDFSNLEQEKYIIVYDFDKLKFTSISTTYNIIGATAMSKETSNKIVDLLNKGRIRLNLVQEEIK